MSISKHIYYADTEYPRVVILNHGGSETQVLSDSDDKIKPKNYNKIWMKREGFIPKNKTSESSWLSKELKRAKENGDL